MYAVMARDEVRCAEMQHQDRLAKAELNQMTSEGLPMRQALSRVAKPLPRIAQLVTLAAFLAVSLAVVIA